MSAGARIARTCATLTVAMAAAKAQAGAWSASADASATGAYDDNVRFTAQESFSDEIGIADAGADLQWHGDTTTIDLRPSARGYYYHHYDPYNRTEGFLTATVHRKGERARYDLTVAGAIDTTLTSEWGFTGYSDANKRREALSASLAPQWDLTERLALVADGSASRSRYIDARLTPLVDYNYRSLMLGLQRQLSERSALTLQATAARMSVPGRALYDKDSYQIVVEYTHEFGPRWQMELAGGPSRVHSPTFHRDDNGFVYTGSASRKGEVASVSLSATRTVSPNGIGALARRDVIALDASRIVTERLTVGCNVSWQRVLESQADGGFTNSRLNYLDASLAIDWRPAQTWTLQLSVHGYEQAYGASSDTAHKALAQLKLSWNGLQRVAG